MYPDPRKVKDNKLSTRFNDDQHERLIYVANVLSEQPSTLMRKLVMMTIDELYNMLQEMEASQLQHLVKYSPCPVASLKNRGIQPVNAIMQPCFA